MQQEITWTPVPAGAQPANPRDLGGGGAVTYRLAVHVSPRITGIKVMRLEDFPDLVEWFPMGLTAEVRVGKASYVARQVSSPERGLWTAIFDPDTPVRSGNFQDFSGRRIRTLASSNLQAFLRDRWGRAAVAFPDDHPDPGTLVGPDWFEPLVFAPDVEQQSRRGKADAAIEQALNDSGTVPARPPLASNGSITTDVVEALKFHEPRGATKPFDVAKPDPDFHELVSFLGNHPALLRRLGLVIDFEFTVPHGLSGQPAVTCMPNAHLRTPTLHLTPSVATTAGIRRFVARPRSDSDLSEDGHLRLDDPARFDVVQVDTDGATFNAVNFAQLVHTRAEDPNVDEPAALPALRSGGVAIARPGQATALAQRLDEATDHRGRLEEGRSALLYADDLVRGWRIDVHNSATDRWHALCDQEATYTFDRIRRTIDVQQEGVVTLAPTASADDPTRGDLYLQETLARWAGWSLVAERPGAGIGPSPDEPVERVRHEQLDRYPVSATYRVPPGSLPVLRFRRSLATDRDCRYRLRARAVSICGDSIPFQPVGGDQHATPVFDYLRFEPVASPVVVLRDPRTEGESPERIVLRSNHDTPPMATPARHILPPRVSQLLVEQHGAVDRETVTAQLERRIGPRPDHYASLASLDANSLATIPDGVQSPGDREGVKHFPVDRMTVPFLVDPLSEGIALRGVPAVDGSVRDVLITWAEAGASWPDFQSIRIELAEGHASPDFDPTTGVLTIFVPKAVTADVRLSSMIHPDNVDSLGLWDWANQAGATFDPIDIARGGHWMFTPFRTLDLVHAVRQPLAEPRVLDLRNERRAGETFFRLQGGLRFDQPSTANVTIHSAWDEYLDAGPGAPAPSIEGAPATLEQRFGAPIDVPGDGPEPENGEWTVALDARHEFGDTKHRVVTYTPEAVTRFGEYFVERSLFTATPAELVVLDPAGLVRGFVTVTTPDRSTAYTAGSDFTVDHDSGTVDLQPAGTSIPARAELEVSWLARPATRLGTVPRVATIPSSARPRVPEVAGVVPTFGWTRSTSGTQSIRSGRGLRVFLKRPWWTSGRDEKLGVVVLSAPPAGPDLDPDVEPYVTQWGRDPVYESMSLPSAHPGTGHFPDATLAVTGLDSAEVGGSRLAVAVHDVSFDAERDVWFADIVVDTAEAYVPWIRLALARYQPHAVEGLELSPIATVDLMQLTADRILTVNRASGEVTLQGPSYHATEAGRGPGSAQVILEARAAGDTRDLGWEPVAEPVELTGSIPANSGTAVWTGTVDPLPSTNAKAEYRLAVLQFEHHLNRDENPVARPVHHDVVPL